MDIFMRNYYDGYEGEPEIQFIKGSIKDERKIIRACSHKALQNQEIR